MPAGWSHEAGHSHSGITGDADALGRDVTLGSCLPAAVPTSEGTEGVWAHDSVHQRAAWA